MDLAVEDAQTTGHLGSLSVGKVIGKIEIHMPIPGFTTKRRQMAAFHSSRPRAFSTVVPIFGEVSRVESTLKPFHIP